MQSLGELSAQAYARELADRDASQQVRLAASSRLEHAAGKE
jgi:hypothetical protein